jgi:hypothetical protein
VEAIADAKAEIFTGVVDGGDRGPQSRQSPVRPFGPRRQGAAAIGKIIDFGRHEDAVVRLIGVDTDAMGSVGARRRWMVTSRTNTG